MPAPQHHRAREGVLYALAAYGLWGLIPLYFKAVIEVPAVEVLAYRIFWSLILLAGLVAWLRRGSAVLATLRNGRVMVVLCATTLLILLNWFTYIYSIYENEVLQSSLGYFICPLVNVLLGVVFLKERIRWPQTAGVLLATIGVAVMAIADGQLPWIALTLAWSFGFYGLLRKGVPADGLIALTVETLILLPLTAGYLIYVNATGTTKVWSLGMYFMLAGSGAATAAPLLFFAAAARRLRLSTIGIMQYLAPTVQFLLAVLAFGEPFTWQQAASFAFIWAAVIVYTTDTVRYYRRSLRDELLQPIGAEAGSEAKETR